MAFLIWSVLHGIASPLLPSSPSCESIICYATSLTIVAICGHVQHVCGLWTPMTCSVFFLLIFSLTKQGSGHSGRSQYTKIYGSVDLKDLPFSFSSSFSLVPGKRREISMKSRLKQRVQKAPHCSLRTSCPSPWFTVGTEKTSKGVEKNRSS